MHSYIHQFRELLAIFSTSWAIATGTQLQAWKNTATQFLQQIGDPGGANTVLRTVLQKHNRVNSAIYVPTESIKQRLEKEYPCPTARVVLEILQGFANELETYNSKSPGSGSWDKETGRDAVELLYFQVYTQFSAIKNCLIKACESWRQGGYTMHLSYCTMEYSIWLELGKVLKKKVAKCWTSVPEVCVWCGLGGFPFWAGGSRHSTCDIIQRVDCP